MSKTVNERNFQTVNTVLIKQRKELQDSFLRISKLESNILQLQQEINSLRSVIFSSKVIGATKNDSN